MTSQETAVSKQQKTFSGEKAEENVPRRAPTTRTRRTASVMRTSSDEDQVAHVRRAASAAPPSRHMGSAEEAASAEALAVPTVRRAVSAAPTTVRKKASTASDYNGNTLVMSTMSVIPPQAPTPKEGGTDSQSDQKIPMRRTLPSMMKDGAKEKSRIPDTFFKTVVLKINMDPMPKDLEVSFTCSMVVRWIGKNSPFFNCLVIGDQIVDINGISVMRAEDVYSLLKKTPTQPAKMRLIRPWNVKACGDRRPPNRKLDQSYQIIEVYKDTGSRNGFEIRSIMGKCIVGSVEKGSRAAHAFLKDDRILDIDSQSVANISEDIQFVRKRFTQMMASQAGMCSFLIERPIGMSSSPNPSLCAARLMIKNEPEMGNDACEIGAREATRWRMMKGKYRVSGILRDPVMETKTQGPTEQEDTDEDRKAKKKRRKHKRLIQIENGKNEFSKLPSDVKDVQTLQHVTARSGIIGFVRNYLNK